MINLIISIFTIVKLLLNNAIQIRYADAKLDIVVKDKGTLDKVRVICDTLILDYETAYLGCEAPPALNSSDIIQVKSKGSEDIDVLNNILKELNVPCC